MKKELRQVSIAGTGFYMPEKVLTNKELEKTVDTTDEWIQTRTGIKERRISAEGQTTSDLGAKAALDALADAGLKPEDVDLIVTCTLSPDTIFPSTSCLIQKKIGAGRAACFDLESACSGFNYGLIFAESYIRTGMYDTVLLIGAEQFSKILDWTDRNTCVLFGDGAGAVVLRPARSQDRGIIAHEIGADGNGAELLMMPGGGSRNPASLQTIENKMHYLKMNGKEIYKFATKTMVDIVQKVMLKAGMTENDITILVPHQANIRILQHVAERLGLAGDRVFINVHKYGNTSAASIPIALCEAVREKRIKDGDVVAFVSFGAGLTWGAAVMRWEGKAQQSTVNGPQSMASS